MFKHHWDPSRCRIWKYPDRGAAGRFRIFRNQPTVGKYFQIAPTNPRAVPNWRRELAKYKRFLQPFTVVLLLIQKSTWLLWFGQSWFWVVFVMRCCPIFLDFLLLLKISLTHFLLIPDIRHGRYFGRYFPGIGFVCASFVCKIAWNRWEKKWDSIKFIF